MLSSGGIAPHAPAAPSNRSGQSPVDDPNRPPEAGAGIVEVTESSLPLVVGGARQGTRPPRRGCHGQGPLARGAHVVPTTQAATCGKIGPSQLTKVPTDGAQHELICGIHPQPGTNSRPGRWHDQKRRCDRTHVPHPMER
jgi:hypothetical protein